MVKIYKLVGFLNIFDVIPDFAFPVFEHAGELYFQHGKDKAITEFVRVKEEVLLKIIPLPDKNSITITINSDPIYIP